MKLYAQLTRRPWDTAEIARYVNPSFRWVVKPSALGVLAPESARSAPRYVNPVVEKYHIKSAPWLLMFMGGECFHSKKMSGTIESLRSAQALARERKLCTLGRAEEPP